MKPENEIDTILKPLHEKPVQAYISNTIQVADIIEWVVSQIGECEIWQSSFSVSEEYLRRLFFMKQKNLIRNVTLVLDFKATNMTLKLWVFINQLVKHCFLADNHSKILLFKSTSGKSVAVITSQNLTRGNRFESAIITTLNPVFDSLLLSLQNIIKNLSVPLSEIMENQLQFDINDIPKGDSDGN